MNNPEHHGHRPTGDGGNFHLHLDLQVDSTQAAEAINNTASKHFFFLLAYVKLISSS